MGVATAIFVSGLSILQRFWQDAVKLDYITFASSDPPTWHEYLCILTLWGMPTTIIACFVAVFVYRYSFKPRRYASRSHLPDQAYTGDRIQNRIRPVEVRLMRIIRGDLYRVSVACLTVLMILAGVLWAGSYKWSVNADWPRMLGTGLHLSFSLQKGDAVMYMSDRYREPKLKIAAYPSYPPTYIQYPKRILIQPKSWFGFAFQKYNVGWRLTFPMWSVFVISTVWPIVAAIKRLLPGIKPGHCPACNYDLRGSTESITCPECGEPIARSSSQAM